MFQPLYKGAIVFSEHISTAKFTGRFKSYIYVLSALGA
jgi:hypothetical protein